jgi:hypothetical protein
MVYRVPPERLHRIRADANFHRQMSEDVELLRRHQASISLTTVLMCCIDALSAGTGKATYGKFMVFVESHFGELCADLEALCHGKKGSRILYENFRNGFAHLRGPKSRFAIAEDHELDGAWAGELEVEGAGTFVAINLDRLTREFLALLKRLDAKRAV